MALNLRFRDILPSVVVDEFDSLCGALRGIIFREHNEDGTHRDITGDTLTLSGNILSSITAPNMPMCFVPLSATQEIADGVGEDLIWTIPDGTFPATIGSDPFHFLQPTTVGGLTGIRFIPPEPGTYLINSQIRWEAAGAATGKRDYILDVLGEELTINEIDGSTANPTQHIQFVYTWPNDELNRGGFDFSVFQNSGGALDVLKTANSGWVQIIKLW